MPREIQRFRGKEDNDSKTLTGADRPGLLASTPQRDFLAQAAAHATRVNVSAEKMPYCVLVWVAFGRSVLN